MLNPSLEIDIDRLSALYRYGLLDAARDPFIQAVVEKVAAGLGGMTVQAVLVDDHRLYTAASAGRPHDERAKLHSLAAAAIEQMPPLVVDDLARDSRFAETPSVREAPFLRAYAGVALRSPENYAIGVLSASDTSARALLPEHTALLERGVAHVMDHLETCRLARLDPLTGALERGAFSAQVAALAAVATRHRLPLSILAVDLRTLRGLLQSFRTGLGLVVVDRMSGLSRRSTRRFDIFGRLGESTFAMLLPNTDETGARAFGRRIMAGLSELLTVSAEDSRSKMPVGIGIASLRPGLDAPNDLIDRAVRDCKRPWLGEPVDGVHGAQVA